MQALEHRLRSCGAQHVAHGVWDFSRDVGSGIKPTFPALAGRFFFFFLTTEPPGKPNMGSLELRTYLLSPSNFNLPHVKAARLK